MESKNVGDLLDGNVVRQPGDSSCMFHSLCFFLNRMSVTSSYTAAMLRAAINSFILSNRSTILYLGPGSLYSVEECIAFEHSTVERYVTYMSKPSSWGGVIELACFVHLFPVDIYVFRPYPSSCRMEWMATFATSLPARNRDNDCLLLYSGNNHYDSIIDATFGPRYLASFVASDDLGCRNVGVSSIDSIGSAKRRRVFYQSIIETRRGRKPQIRIETVSAQRKVDYRQRALNATRCFLAVAKPFQYYDEGKRSRRSSTLDLDNRGCSDSAVDAAAYSTAFDSLTKYIVCAIYGYEGSRAGCVLVSDISDLIEMSGIAAKFDAVVSSERAFSRFDAVFKSELNAYFKDGLIRGVDSICRVCYRQLLLNMPIKKESPLTSYSVISEQLDSSDEQSLDDVGSGPFARSIVYSKDYSVGLFPMS